MCQLLYTKGIDDFKNWSPTKTPSRLMPRHLSILFHQRCLSGASPPAPAAERPRLEGRAVLRRERRPTHAQKVLRFGLQN
jgi:hypothetical protein